MNEEYLSHHGIKGQKWGIRRFQNADGSLTDDGRKRYGSGEAKPKTTVKDVLTSKPVKNIAKVALIAGSVMAAEHYYQNNMEAVDAVVSKMADAAMKELKSSGKKAVDAGKTYMVKTAKAAANAAKVAGQEALAGAKEGAKAAPRKVTKVAVEGAAILAAKKMLESVVSKEEADRYIQAYNAYNKKSKVGRIDSSSTSENRNDNDDEDV